MSIKVLPENSDAKVLPDVVLVLPTKILVSDVIVSPTWSLSSIPTPPVTINAPVDSFVASVLSVIVTAPLISAAPFMSKLVPSISPPDILPDAVIASTPVKLPSISALPLISKEAPSSSPVTVKLPDASTSKTLVKVIESPAEPDNVWTEKLNSWSLNLNNSDGPDIFLT